MSDEPLYTLRLRLTFADCDPIGIVYFSAYYPWMERTYAEWTMAAGVPGHRNQEQLGIHTVIARSGCDYIAAGGLYDALRCELRCQRLGRTSYTLGFDFIREEDSVNVARGSMQFVCIGADERPTGIPARLAEALSGVLQ